MDLFFGIFLTLALLLPLSGMGNGAKAVRGGIMLLPPTVSRREQERIRTSRFLERTRDFASSLGRGRTGTFPIQVKMGANGGNVYIKWDGVKASIFLEEDFSLLSARKENLHLLAGWFLLLENGIPPQKVKNKEFYTSFLVTGVARKACMDAMRRFLPYSDYYPCARSLAARGVFPTLSRCLQNPGERAWSSTMSLYSEYCELILLFMLQRRGMEKASFTRLLSALALSGESSQEKLFFDLLRHEEKKKKSRNAAGSANKIPPEDLEDHYTAFLKRKLLNPMQVLSLENWEDRYRKLLTFSGEGLSGVPGEVPLASPFFPEVFEKLKDPDKKVFQILQELLALGNISPPSIRDELHNIRKALLQYRNGRMKKKDLETLLAAEKKLFAVLEKEYALREFLAETERRSFPPTLLFQRSLYASRSWEEKEKQNLGERFSALFAGAMQALDGMEGGK